MLGPPVWNRWDSLRGRVESANADSLQRRDSEPIQDFLFVVATATGGLGRVSFRGGQTLVPFGNFVCGGVAAVPCLLLTLAETLFRKGLGFDGNAVGVDAGGDSVGLFPVRGSIHVSKQTGRVTQCNTKRKKRKAPVGASRAFIRR